MGALLGLFGGAGTGIAETAMVARICYMCGPCIMYGCCNLAKSGATMTTGASCCLLLWLQVFAALLGVLLSADPEKWLEWPCSVVSKTGDLIGKWSDVGICACFNSESEHCFDHQIIYRSQASALVLFLFLVILCIGGCGKEGAKYAPCGKFLLVLIVFFVTLFFPNDYFERFGEFARTSAVVFLVGQTILVIDFAYRWNETWIGFAHEALRRRLDTTTEKAWKCGLIICSLIFAGFAFCSTVALFNSVELTAFRCILLACLVLSLVLLGLSITVLDNSGGLLCSCIVMAYVIFLCHEAAAAMPGIEDGAFIPNWVGLFICTAFLIEFTFRTRTQGGEKEFLGDGDEQTGHLDTWMFLQACLWHTTCSVFVCAKLTPQETWTVYTAHCIGACLAVCLYGWTLVAPVVLTNRQFT